MPPCPQLASAEAGAEEAQQGVSSTSAITLMWAEAAAADRALAAFTAAVLSVPGPVGWKNDHGNSTRTIWALSERAVDISRLIAAVLELPLRAATVKPRIGPAC